MKKFEGILICTDLDGTLLRDDKTISEENINAINYFKDNGGLFTFVTGRMPFTASRFIDELHPNAPIGCINGGALYDFSKMEYLWKQPLPSSALDLVEYIAQKTDVGIQINTFDHIYSSRNNPGMQEFFRRVKTECINRHWNDVEEPLSKVLFADLEDEKIEEVMKLLASHPHASEFDFVRSEKILYEVLPKGINKGVAIKKLCECCGISPDKTIAVGDYNNDVEMLKAAKIGVAVENACPEAKAAADVITVSNENHALAQIIYDIENGILKI